MANWISDGAFSGSEGVDDWRVLYWGAKACFRTADFTTGAGFVTAIAGHAASLSHDQAVDLRDDSVTVQVLTPAVGLTDLDLELARRISVSAAEMGLIADPTRVQQVQLAFDCEDRAAVTEFWRAALGYVQVSDQDILPPDLIGPTAWFQDKPHVTPRNRVHVDVSVPYEQAQQRVDAILAAGGRMLGDRHAPAYWSLIDVDGNVVDIATWQGRD